jgi:hypothetical protein
MSETVKCTYDLLRKSVRHAGSGRRALMFLGKPRNARQGGTPAHKILGIRLCGPAGIETGFRDRRGQQRQGPASHKAGPLKNGGFRHGWDGGLPPARARYGFWLPTRNVE